MHEVNPEMVSRLQDKAAQMRRQLLIMCNKVGMCHLGGGLSVCEMAVALYYEFLNYDPKDPKWEKRDRLILSKGHTACLFYNIFADLGMYSYEDIYNGYNKINGKFGIHPHRKYIPAIEASTGSLGHGLSIAMGLAFAGRMDKAYYRVLCITGDGELDEGSNWEAMMCAAHYKLGNLVAIVDRNYASISGQTEKYMSLEPLVEKWQSFGWDVRNIADGNDMEQVAKALASLPEAEPVKPGKPVCLISNTVKGKGVDFMEKVPGWHSGHVSDESLEECLRCVEKNRKCGR